MICGLIVAYADEFFLCSGHGCVFAAQLPECWNFIVQTIDTIRSVCVVHIIPSFLQNVQDRHQDIMLVLTSLQTTDTSKVDISTKHGVSVSYYILINYLSHQEVEGMVPNGWLQFESHHWIFLRRPVGISRHFCWDQNRPFFFLTGSWTSSIRDRGNQNRYFKWNHDCFLILTKCSLFINLTWAWALSEKKKREKNLNLQPKQMVVKLQHKEPFHCNLSEVLQKHS